LTLFFFFFLVVVLGFVFCGFCVVGVFPEKKRDEEGVGQLSSLLFCFTEKVKVSPQKRRKNA